MASGEAADLPDAGLSVLINGEFEMSIKISSIEEASEEKLNEIIQMLLDNMVIINTEG